MSSSYTSTLFPGPRLTESSLSPWTSFTNSPNTTKKRDPTQKREATMLSYTNISDSIQSIKKQETTPSNYSTMSLETRVVSSEASLEEDLI